MKKLSTTFNIVSILLIIVSIFKLTLLNKGFYTFDDERRYFISASILKSLSEFNIQQAIEFVFTIQGRPGEALIKLIPSVFQQIGCVLFGYQRFETQNTLPLFIFNNIIFSLLLVVHYKFSLFFLKSKTLSLFSVLLFSTLIISYISLRHADPYDFSLLVLYYLLYKIVQISDKTELRWKTFFGYGFLAFYGYSCYPGYILLFFAIPITHFLSSLKRANIVLKIKQISFYTLGSLLCLICYELLSRTVGKSYITESLTLSKTIVQGSFDEGFTFLFDYLTQVEQINGIILILGLLLYLFVFLHQYYNSKSINNFHVLIFVLLITFVFYASLGYYFQKVVWYARLIKQYVPFLIIILLYSVHYLANYYKVKKNQLQYGLLGLSSIFLLTFYIQITEYKSYYYTNDVIWTFYNSTNNVQIFSVYEDANKVKKKIVLTVTKGIKKPSKKYYCTIPSIYPLYNYNQYVIYKPKKNEKLVFSELSYTNFKAYQFEGYSAAERKILDKIKFKIRVYEVQ